MKTMKKLGLLLIVAAMLLALISCGKQDVAGSATVVVGETVYTVSLDEIEVTEGLFSLLEYLKQTQGLTYDATDSTYGKYIHSIGDLQPQGQQYISLYTSVESDFDTSAYCQKTECQGKQVATSGVGASSMKVEDGAVFLLTLASY